MNLTKLFSIIVKTSQEGICLKQPIHESPIWDEGRGSCRAQTGDILHYRGKLWPDPSSHEGNIHSSIAHHTLTHLSYSLFIFPRGLSAHARLEIDSTRSTGWLRSVPGPPSRAESYKSHGGISITVPNVSLCKLYVALPQGCLGSPGSHTMLKLTQELTTQCAAALEWRLAWLKV